DGVLSTPTDPSPTSSRRLTSMLSPSLTAPRSTQESLPDSSAPTPSRKTLAK
ncbi:unnamed protein product, partial [Nesidiocoris tenuis]